MPGDLTILEIDGGWRYDSSTCNRATSPQPKVANHATDAVIVEATKRKATALFLVLAANMASFSVEVMRCIKPSYERVFLMSCYFSLRHSLGCVAQFTKIEKFNAIVPVSRLACMRAHRSQLSQECLAATRHR